MKSQLKVGVVGLGKQTIENHLPAIEESPMFQLQAVCDTVPELVKTYSGQYNVAGYTTVKEMLERHKLDLAIVAVPHCYYVPTIQLLAENGVHVVKEKPFATSMKEALEMQEIIQKHKIFLGITLQRRFNPIFQAFTQLVRRIGTPYIIEGRYTFNIKRLDEGWRASKAQAGGGALIDMGYHLVDLLVWYFGLPDNVTARMSLGNRLGQKYDVEDSVHLMFDYNFNGSHHSKMVGDVLISRVYPKKDELLRVIGTHGSIELKRGLIQRFDPEGNVVDHLERQGSWTSAAVDQLEHFGIQVQKFNPEKLPKYHEQLKHIAIVEAAYRSDQQEGSVKPADILREYGFEEVLKNS